MKLFPSILICYSLIVLSGCGHLSYQSLKAAKSTNEPNLSANPSDTDQENHPYQNSPSFDPETLYSLLVAEVASKRGRYDIALGNYLEQSQETQDPAILAHTTRLAEYMKAEQAALNTAIQWVKAEPESLEANQYAVALLIKAGRLEEAFPYIDHLFAQNGVPDLERLIKQVTQTDPANVNSVIDKLYKLSEKYQKIPQLWATISNLEHYSGDIDASLIAINKALNLYPYQPEFAIQKADLLNILEQPIPAYTLIKKTHRKHPKHFRTHIFYIQQLGKLTKHKKAKKQIAALINNSSNRDQSLYSMAILALDSNYLDLAESYFSELIQRKSFIEESHFFLGRVYQKQHKYELSIKHFREIKRGANRFNAMIQSVYSYESLNQLDKAIEVLRQAQALNPDLGKDLKVTEANVLFKAKRYLEALDVVNEAILSISDLKEEEHSIFYLKSIIEEKLGDIPAAEMSLRYILDDFPDDPVAMNALGYTLANRTSRYDEALTLIEKALKIQPDNPAFLDSMGWVQFHMGNIQLALEYLKRAYDQMSDAEVASHLGEAYWVSEQQQKAISIWLDAIEQEPDHEILIETINKYAPELLKETP